MNAIGGRKKAATLNRRAKLAAVREPSIEVIRKRAYELFLARDSTHGADLADWFEAEQELRAAPQRLGWPFVCPWWWRRGCETRPWL